MEAAELKVISPLTIVGGFIVLAVGYSIAKAFYDVCYGPLSHIPGPKLPAMSFLPHVRALLFGEAVSETVRLHKKYGDMVRLSPREVSFTSAETAFTDIYGFRTGKMKGHLNMQKDPMWYGPPMQGKPSILMANDDDHSRTRRVLAHAFSEKALAAQEPLLQDYVDQLISGLKAELARNSTASVDLVTWFNWTTFDVITDLLFGEPLGSLKKKATHKHLELLLDLVVSQASVQALEIFPWLKPLARFFADSNLLRRRKEYAVYIARQVEKRINRPEDCMYRPDFMTEILAHNLPNRKTGTGEPTLSRTELYANAGFLVIAGSETSATTLSAATYLLTRHPTALRKLQREVRTAFASYADITLESVCRLPYLIAVLNEALCHFPPVPAGFVRVIGPGGEYISGTYVPEGTAVSVSQYAAGQSPANFSDPQAFVPERWLDATAVAAGLTDAATLARYADDRKAGHQPFSTGPRACLSRNLAYAEMRLILAKMVWSFDFALAPEGEGWMKRCKYYLA